VRRSKPAGTDRRTSWYEVREPLLRHYLQYRETRGEPLRVIVGFLRAWYVPHERFARLADAEPGSPAERYLSRTASFELGGSEALYNSASADELIAAARCVLDDEPRDARRALHGPSAAIVAEAVGLDAWRGRAQAMYACRSRLGALDGSCRERLADVLAAALSTTGEPVMDVDLLAPRGLSPGAPSAALGSPAAITVRTRIASALSAAVTVADARLELRERVELRLLTAGWIGACGASADACALLELTVPLAGGLDPESAGLRLAVGAELAFYLFESGRREEGRSLCERVLDDRLVLLGPDDQDTLTSRSDLAYILGEMGDPTAARDLLAVVAADRGRVLGADHPNVLLSRSLHASFVGEAGDRAAARELSATVAADLVRGLGADHPGTLSSRYGHAYNLDLAGDSKAAAIIAADVLGDGHHALGVRHPLIQASRALFLALVAWRDPGRGVLVGDDPQLREACEAVLRLDAGLAVELLAAWCALIGRLEEPLRAGAIARVVEIAVDAGRATELGTVLLRTLPVQAEAGREQWTASWLAALGEREELAVAGRMLRAAGAALDGDATAMLTLPAEEQRVVEKVVAASRDAASDSRQS